MRFGKSPMYLIVGEKMINSAKIDAVIMWVDGADKEWQKEKFKYSGKDEESVDASEVRYRDWGLLKYWFRGIEKYAPWINNVFFITCGQRPEWLNVDCQKLKCVNHSDYMPKEFLPTFSANPIELNLHRIEDLQEDFIFFNDDMFVLNSISQTDFFSNGLPVLPAELHCIVPLAGKSEKIMSHIYVNDITVINRHFDIKTLRENKHKWISPFKNGMKASIMTCFESRHAGYVGFFNHHLPVPIRKSTIKEIWNVEYETLYRTSLNRFRSSEDVNQYLFRYWELARQSFVPIKASKLGSYYVIPKDTAELDEMLTTFSGKMICLNDSDIDDKCSDEEYQSLKEKLLSFFEKRLPEKSAFEK